MRLHLVNAQCTEHTIVFTVASSHPKGSRGLIAFVQHWHLFLSLACLARGTMRGLFGYDVGCTHHQEQDEALNRSEAYTWTSHGIH